MNASPRLASLALLVAALGGCDGANPSTDAGAERPLILEVRAPEPAVEGSVLEVRGLGFDTLGDSPRLAIERAGAPISQLTSVPDTVDGRLLFLLSYDAVAELGPGRHSIEVTVIGGGGESDPYPMEIRLVSSLPVDLFAAPNGEVHKNDVQVVTGAGIIAPTEGELTARFVGTYSFDAGGSRSVDSSLPVSPLERFDRERGVVVLTTDIGGLMPGTFDGTIQLVSILASGERTESMAVASSLHFNPPELYTLSPMNASLGQIITVGGAGFLGGNERVDELTILRIEGRFTPQGGSPEPFGPTEVVPRWVSGSEVQLLIEPEMRSGTLISALFGHARGTFEGMATPVTSKGTEELQGTTVPFGFTLGALRQVICVRFLPGFYDSLVRFGLGAAAPEVEDAVRERMEGIYAAWNVDIRLEEPDDFTRNGYSVVEVGGPDPNGSGLFGYDNTPGKDVGNLRLFDAIGGTNAETQADGYPGFGGVFVESFLYWSSHPDLPGERPLGAPDADPLFDEAFDPVREMAARRVEVEGGGDPDRAAAVRRAISALGSLIGETTSHEIGHSLGMAQPSGPATVYHNNFDGDGCIMDSGGDRPLGERLGLSGFAPTQFCGEHPAYLSEILGR